MYNNNSKINSLEGLRHHWCHACKYLVVDSEWMGRSAVSIILAHEWRCTLDGHMMDGCNDPNGSSFH